MTIKLVIRAARNGAGPVLLTCGLAGLLAVTGCGSSSSQPSWASALGSGVTVSGPAQVAAGNGSPAAAIEGLYAAINAKHYTAECAYVEPSQQAACKTGLASMTSADAPYFSNGAVGYVAVDGNQALVSMTGKFCTPGQKPECYTNNDPAAIFSSNKGSFATLWTEENKVSAENVNSLAPCIKIGGKWYLYETS
jgi:hypothetical protein